MLILENLYEVNALKEIPLQEVQRHELSSVVLLGSQLTHTGWPKGTCRPWAFTWVMTGSGKATMSMCAGDKRLGHVIKNWKYVNIATKRKRETTVTSVRP